MKKKHTALVVGLAGAALAIGLALLFLLPVPLANGIDTEAELQAALSVYHFDPPGDTEVLRYYFSPGAPEYVQIQQIVEKYTCHRTMQTIAGNLSPGISSEEWILSLFSGERRIVAGGTADVIINDHVYRLYGGKEAVSAVMNDIRTVLEGT